MTTLVVAALCALALFTAADAVVPYTRIWGGASSLAQLGSGLYSGYPAGLRVPDAAFKYDSVGSGKGIDGFNGVAGLAAYYVVGMSDDPMSNTQERTGNSGVYGKMTVPLVLSTYSFFTKTGGSVKLSAKNGYNAFAAPTTWKAMGIPFWGKATYPAGGPIPYGRGDASGTTGVIKSYWVKLGFLTGIVDQNPFKFPKITNVQGGGALCSAAAGRVNAITYSQVGLCRSYPISEAYVQQAAGTYILSSGVDLKHVAQPINAIPRPLPGNDQSWASVNLLNKNGPDTPPLVSFEYAFIRKTGLTAGDTAGLGRKGKAFLSWAVTNANKGLASKYYFDTLPPDVIANGLAAIAKVV